MYEVSTEHLRMLERTLSNEEMLAQDPDALRVAALTALTTCDALEDGDLQGYFSADGGVYVARDGETVAGPLDPGNLAILVEGWVRARCGYMDD